MKADGRPLLPLLICDQGPRGHQFLPESVPKAISPVAVVRPPCNKGGQVERLFKRWMDGGDGDAVGMETADGSGKRFPAQ